MGEHLKNIGYSWLEENGFRSLSKRSSMRKDVCLTTNRRTYDRSRSAPDDGPKIIFNQSLDGAYDSMGVLEHLIYALKIEGIDLSLICDVLKSFGSTEKEALRKYMEAAPRSRNTSARKLAYIYEAMTGDEIDISNGVFMHTESAPLFDPDLYYTASITYEDPIASKYKLYNNALGDISSFCPVVRKTQFLKDMDNMKYGHMIDMVYEQAERIDSHAVQMAVYNSLNIECKKSYQIENDADGSQNSRRRMARFADLLSVYKNEKDFLYEGQLAQIQSVIVNKSAADRGYRNYQNGVGLKMCGDSAIMKYLPPDSKYVHSMMDGLRNVYDRCVDNRNNLSPIVAAAIVSAGFVMIHPFGDGNGRISRLLIHNILSRNNFCRPEIIVPISEVIYNNNDNIRRYYDSLISITAPIMDTVDYECGVQKSEDGYISYDLNIKSRDHSAYCYPDMTMYAETLYSFAEEAAKHNIPQIYEKALRNSAAVTAISKDASFKQLFDTDYRQKSFIEMCVNNVEGVPDSRVQQYKAMAAEKYGKDKKEIEEFKKKLNKWHASVVGAFYKQNNYGLVKETALKTDNAKKDVQTNDENCLEIGLQ